MVNETFNATITLRVSNNGEKRYILRDVRNVFFRTPYKIYNFIHDIYGRTVIRQNKHISVDQLIYTFEQEITTYLKTAKELVTFEY